MPGGLYFNYKAGVELALEKLGSARFYGKKMIKKSTILEVHVQPGAGSDEIVGFRNGVLYLKVTAPPHRGQANRAALKLMGRVLGMSQGSIEIIRGHTGRNKVLGIYGLDSNDLKKALMSYSEIK